MTMHRLKWLAVALAAMPLVPAAPAAAQPKQLQVAPGNWTPQGTQVNFPEKIGEYERVSAYEYGPDNWSVGYQGYRGGKLEGVITVYLYARAAGTGCASEFAEVRTAIEQSRPDAAKLAEASAPSPRGTLGVQAVWARYRFDLRFDGTDQPVFSDAYLYCHPGSRWWIKYRATWPAGEDRSSEAAAVLRAIGWPADLVE